MKTIIQLKTGIGTLLYLFVAALVIPACMKKKCVTCTTAYPVSLQDTFYYRQDSSYYCDITVEKEKYLEEKGSRDTIILVNGKDYLARISTDCQ